MDEFWLSVFAIRGGIRKRQEYCEDRRMSSLEPSTTFSALQMYSCDRKPLIKQNRVSLEVFGGTPILMQAGLYGGPAFPNQDAPPGGSTNLLQSVYESSGHWAGVDTNSQWPFERKVTSTVPSLAQSFRKLAEAEKYLLERKLETGGVESKQNSPRSSSCKIKTSRGNQQASERNLMKVEKESSLSQEFMAERVAEWRPALNSA